MTNPATTSLLDRASLDRDAVRSEIARGLAGADDGELFLEYSQTEALTFDNGRLKQATYDTSQGFGLRAVKDDAVGYAHSSDVSLPALMRAHKIQRRCSAVGFDWTSLGPVLDKVHEEIDEVMHEAQQAVVDEAKLEEEVGDLLFATVNLSRHLGVKAEVALQKANLKFERRFREVERIVAARGLEMTGVDLDTMEEVWQEVKRQETDL